MTGSRAQCEQCGNPRVDLFYAVIAMGLNFNELCCCDVSPEFVEAATAGPVIVCKRCSKRMQDEDQTGSIQWIFRQSVCSCPAPEPQQLDSHMVEELVNQLVDQKRKRKERLAKDVPEMQVDDRKFPYQTFKPLQYIDSAGGRVFKCRDRQLGNLVVVKMLKTRDLQPHQLNQLQKEAKFVSELEHENILKILDFGILRETYPFIVTEYADSETLRSVLDKSGRIQTYTAIQIISQVCDALGNAHGRGLFHWNLTPDKILLKNASSTDPIVKLTDFGFALNAVTGGTFQTDQGMTLVGTSGYMSPEQANGKDFDASSEVYTIGCVLFEMLTGVLPFNAQTQREVLVQQTQRAIPKLSEMSRREFPAELERIVSRCLQPNKEDRHSSVAQLRRAINTFTRRTSVAPEAIPEDPWKVALREHKAKIVLVVLGVLVGTMWAAFAWLTSESAYNALGKPGSPMESFFVVIGNDRAKVQLGQTYLNAVGEKRNTGKAVELFTDAAAHGSTAAEFWLGYCYLKGYARLQQHGEGGYAGAFTSVSQAAEVEQQNYAQAYAYISKAAEKGFPAAERYKGMLIRIGMIPTGQVVPTSKGRTKRLADSDAWIKKAANHGDPEAVNFLGIQKAEEFGWAPQSYAGAFDYSKKSENQKEEMFGLFQEAAQAGQPDAQFNMALCYELGVGTLASNDSAKKWYQVAAKSDVLDAQYRYGFLLELEKNPDAVDWYKKAALRNHLYAQIALCRCYSEGFCVPYNRNLTQYWYGKVMEHPNRYFVKEDLFGDTIDPQLSLEKVISGMERISKGHLEMPHLLVQRWGPSGIKCWPTGPMRDIDMIQLSTMKDVTFLDLYGMSIGDRGTKYLPGLPITMLRLAGQDLSRTGYANIAKLKSLKGIELSGDQRTDGLKQLGDCRYLVFVGVTGLISQETVDQIAAIKSLRSIAFHCRKDVSLASWGNLPNLEGLRLDEATQKTINSLSTMKNLKLLTIAAFKQNGSSEKLDLAPLANLTKLERLRLNQSLDPHVVGQLKALKHLQELSITSTKGVSDNDLLLLKGIPAKSIEIFLDADCAITDKGLMILGSIPNVTHVNISASPVTKNGLKAFREKFPNHSVSYSEKGRKKEKDIVEDQVEKQVNKQIKDQIKEQKKKEGEDPTD